MREYVPIYLETFEGAESIFTRIGFVRRETILAVDCEPSERGLYYPVTFTSGVTTHFPSGFYHVRSLADLGIETSANASDKRAA